MNIIPKIFLEFADVKAGQSTRLGGVSAKPFESLNLGKSVGDDLESVLKNRTIFFEACGLDVSKVAVSYQVHGSEILEVMAPGNYEGYDALITNIPNICIAVSIADCTPILIFDNKNKAIAAIHAGWKGTVANIVAKTCALMNEKYGTLGENCYAFIGACISEKSFEVNHDVAQHFDIKFKTYLPDNDKYLVDLKAANKAQLLDFGLQESQIEISNGCTVLQNDLYFSHRKENGKTGRMMAAIGLF